MELVPVTTRSAPSTASSAVSTGVSRASTRGANSRQKRSRLAGLGLNTLTSVMGRTAQWAINCPPACQPVPSSAITEASSRAR